MLNRTIYIAGPDGVGKTMYINYVEGTIEEKKNQTYLDPFS